MISYIGQQFADFKIQAGVQPLFICGDAQHSLAELPDACIDFCMTSPPYWNKREYHHGGIGLELRLDDYMDRILGVFREVHRVLKPTGSLWLNLGDSYVGKGLMGVPWRVALALIDQQGWFLRNDVIWNKIKGPDNTKDKLRGIHEYIFHFVKQTHGFYYDVDAVRTTPRSVQVKGDVIVSATGVTGVRYRRQIELSTALTDEEKQLATQALDQVITQLVKGEISDFRMVIRKQHRTTHSDSLRLSGRAKELHQKGFYFLKYHPNGSKPSDVWEIIPEDRQGRDDQHYAAYPEDLCKIPLLATCPPDGIVLDPFCGTGTTNVVARNFGRKSIGIDLSSDYIATAKRRCASLL